jgi:hypothetical protein
MTTPMPHWPSSFFANFTETFSVAQKSAVHHGWFALDLNYSSGGFVGAEAIYRVDGQTAIGICKDFHKDTACIELAVAGQRYIVFPEIQECCRCCSWKNGCGPLRSAWVDNASFIGVTPFDGEQCNRFSIPGEVEKENYISQTLDGKQLCELNNGGADQMNFTLSTWSGTVDPRLFDLPAGCDKHCGQRSACLIG